MASIGRWFGLILLPLVSFAGDGTVAVTYFVRYMFRHFFHTPSPPTTLARAEAIDLSIQFTLFWMPFFVLLAWWTGKPLSLLFGVYAQGCIILNSFD
jgi:Ca2+:H+ antiporter